VTADLLAFLRARLDEDADRIARNSSNSGLSDTGSYPDYQTHDNEDTAAADNYLAAFTPRRMLAEVDAKRRILTNCGVLLLSPFAEETEYTRAIEHGIPRLLALPYTRHPDYRPEWAPES
jgi:hypothetical protein